MVEEQDQATVFGRGPQEFSGSPVVEKALPLSQALVEGLVVGEEAATQVEAAKTEVLPNSGDAALGELVEGWRVNG